MTENVIRIISFSAGILFSAALLGFSFYQISRDPSSQLWTATASSIVSLFLPSPMQLTTLSKLTLTESKV